MQFWRWLLLFAAFIGLGYWLSSAQCTRSPAPNATALEEEPDQPPRSLTETRLPSLSPTTAPPSNAAQQKSESSPPLNTVVTEVAFENRDGLAIAWGDVVLGQLNPDFGRDGGLTKLKAPDRWPTPQIPFLISPLLPHPERVRQAVETLSRETAAQLIEVGATESTTKIDLIVFEPAPEPKDGSTTQVCLSALGRTGGAQPIRLAPGCGVPEILHEVMHALGFIHEHSRPDRDQFLQVHWDRIDPLYQKQFGIVPQELMGPATGTPFDPQSIMLYSSDLFSTHPGLPALTLRARAGASADLNNGLIPPATRLSEQDRARIAKLWN